jgi:predicted dehydrogenase
MWDIGCYGVNAARYFTGAEPTDVSASAHWGETGVDLSMRMGLTFPGEVLANIDCSFEAPWRCRAELVGTKGRIVLENAFQSLSGQVVSLQRGMFRGSEVEEIPVEEVNQYEVQLRHFCHSIREGSLLPPAENGLDNMIVLERILEDARARRRIVA